MSTALLEVRCPKCGAEIGKPCWIMRGVTVGTSLKSVPHPDRAIAALRYDNA